MAEMRAEVEQLGMVDSIGGDFDLTSFVEALEANLSIASHRERGLGDGVLVTDYRLAAGLSFERVFVCGAYEGAFAAAAGTEPLLQDRVWSALRRTHPFVDDLASRLDLANAAAARVLRVARDGVLTWSCPLQALGAWQRVPAAARGEEPA